MTCQECEIKLGMGEDAVEHLASCEACRLLAEDLRLNALALREMRIRTRVRWEWALAAAAGIVMAIFTWQMTRVEILPLPPVRVAVAEAPPQAGHGPAPQKRAKRHLPPHAVRGPDLEPMRVKMFTSDPDVVIYWIVDRKEKSE